MSSLCSPESFNYLKSSPDAPVPQINEGMDQMEACQMTQCTFWFHYHASSSSYPFHQPHLLFFLLLPFSCYFSLRSLSCVSFSLSWWGFCPQSRLARLVVGPFWGWNCTGGRPSVHCNATHHTLLHSTFQKYPGSPFVGWLIGAVLTLMRLCSGRLQAAMWSCRSCWEKFWCIWAASWASMLFPQALFRSEGRRSLWQLDPPSTSDFVLVQPHRYFC